MKLPCDISGRELVKALCRHWSYQQVHQVGSHIILQTDSPYIIDSLCPIIHPCA